jgi:hypothetical protein
MRSGHEQRGRTRQRHPGTGKQATRTLGAGHLLTGEDYPRQSGQVKARAEMSRGGE